MEYNFRKAVMQDFKEVAALYHEAVSKMIDNQLLQWDEIYPNEEVLFEDILREEMYLLIENSDDNKIAACVVINEEQDDAYLTGSWRYIDERIAVIHRLCVHPSLQGAGIGRRTMQQVEELMKENGYSIVRLDAFSQNSAARKLYESLGYTYAGEVQFRKGLFLLMEKALGKYQI